MDTEQLVKSLVNGNADERLQAAENLVGMDARLTVFQFKDALSKTSEGKQKKALKSLAQLGKKAIPLLIEMLKRGNAPEKDLASDALVQIGAPAVQAVIVCLQDRNWAVRSAAAETLGNMGDSRAVQPLIRVLEERPNSETAGERFGDWDGYACSSVIKALGKLGDGRALEPLTQMSDDPSESVRQDAAQILSNWKHKGAVQKHVSVDMCTKMLDDPNNEVRLSAVRTLASLNDPQAIQALFHGLKDSFLCGEILDKLEKIQFNSKSVDILLSAVEEGNQLSDSYILDKLKQIGPAAANSLAKALNTENRAIRLMAARALASFKDTRAIDALLNLVQAHGDNTILVSRALAEIGQAAIQPLLERLQTGDDPTSLTASFALTEMGTRAIPLLIQAMDNSQTEAYARYECADFMTTICQRNKESLKDKWSLCVCSEHLVEFIKSNIPLHTNIRRALETRNQDYYMRQSPALSKLASYGVLSSGFSELLSTVFTTDYYACPVCSQDRTYFSPVKQIILVLDDAKNPAPAVKNQVLYYPWSPLMSAFRFHRVEIRSIEYPYSTTIERFIHRLELERRPAPVRTIAQTATKISCTISVACKLSPADQNRLQVYFNLQ